MAGQQRPRSDPRSETIDEFMERSGRELRSLGRNARAAAHQAFDKAIQVGRDLPLKRPSDLEALGARLLQGGAPLRAPPQAKQVSRPSPAPLPSGVRTSAGPQQLPTTGLGSRLRDAALQADTAFRSAANTLTLHGADKAAAGMDALLRPGGLGDWPRRYKSNLAAERRRNDFDAVHRPTAQALGSLAGAGLGIGLLGPMEGPLAASARLAGAAPLTMGDMAGIAAGGGAVGLGTQWLSDVAAGGRRSSVGDNVGAAVGGAAGALAAVPLGPARAGAVQGALTSAVQDVLNERPVSADRAGESALFGHLFGGLAGIAGRRLSDDLPTKAKGPIGEYIGDIRRMVNGYGRRPFRSKVRDKIKDAGGKYWVPDDWKGDMRFEDKFGVGADLSGPQKLARKKLGSDFHLTHTLPADVGRAAGVPAAAAGSQIVDKRRPR